MALNSGNLVIFLFAISSSAHRECDTELPEGGGSCPSLEYSSYPDPLDCTSFWQCYNGCPEHMSCPSGTYFDAEHGWCDEASAVDCGDRPHPEVPTTSPQPQTIVSTTEPDCGHFFNCSGMENGFYADPYNCRKYWECVEGAGIHTTCRDQLLWRVDMNWCDYPENVICGHRPVCDECDENCEQKPEPVSCTAFCKSDFGDFSLGCCSSNYCRCDNGKGVVFNCPNNLVFVEEKDQCDYRSNVPCCSK